MTELAPTPKAAIRGIDGRYIHGSPGRLKGSRNTAALLEDALRKVEKARTPGSACLCVRAGFLPCKTIDQHFATQAFLDNTVLIAFQRKRIPDLIHQTAATPPTQVNIVYGHTQPRVQVVEALHTNGA